MFTPYFVLVVGVLEIVQRKKGKIQNSSFYFVLYLTLFLAATLLFYSDALCTTCGSTYITLLVYKLYKSKYSIIALYKTYSLFFANSKTRAYSVSKNVLCSLYDSFVMSGVPTVTTSSFGLSIKIILLVRFLYREKNTL